MGWVLKVVQLGNIANIGLNYAKYLRKAGVECDLLVPDQGSKNPEEYGSHPWVRFWKRQDPVRTLWTLKKMTAGYDLIHAHAGAAAYAQFLGKPFVAHSMGSDLRKVAVRPTPQGLLLKRAFQTCDRFFFSQPDQLPLVQKMNLDAVFVHQIVDTDRFAPDASAHRGSGGLAVFHPPYHVWDLKGNDKLIKAFARFVTAHPEAVLVCVNWGSDLDKSKQLVTDLGMDRSVRFVDYLTVEQLAATYAASDVVADEFDIGSFGMASLEAMACGKPVIRCIDEILHRRFYDESAPVANASSPEQILARLEELAEKPAREELGMRARRFVMDHHHWKSVTGALVREYGKIL